MRADQTPGATTGRVKDASDFVPAAWLPGPHLPTIWGSVCRKSAEPAVRQERLELPDGDFVDLAVTAEPHQDVVIVLHGLEGSLESSYARALLHALDAARFQAVLMHFRGCSGEPNRLPRYYHSGDTGDLAYLVEHITAARGRAPFAVVGYSLGGNVALKWLGESRQSAPVRTAAAVSVPFDLGACADRLDEGFSRVYQRRLVRSMCDKYCHKFADGSGPVSPAQARRLRTFWEYDDRVTAPLHGFRDVDDYYGQSSSRAYLSAIETPTLILHAIDDPFVPARAIPTAGELGPTVTLELTRGGGHVGFVHGAGPASARYWAETRIVTHLNEVRDGPSGP